MSVIIILIIASIIVASLFLLGFIWAVKSGQYDDTASPAVRMLFENQKTRKSHKIGNAVKKDDRKKNPQD